MTPIGLKFSYNYFNKGYRYISLVFLYKKSESGNIKLTINNLPDNYPLNLLLEIVRLNQCFLNENLNADIFENINTLIFSIVLIERIFKIFPNFIKFL